MEKFNLPIKVFKTQKDWEKWLVKNHTKPEGVWLKFYKKASGIKSLNYAEALNVALMFGWIDGQARGLDEKAYLQRFTQRRSKSPWSKINIDHIARLTKAGRMKSAGLAAVEQAKANGQWANAYHGQSKMVMPKHFLKKLAKNKKGLEFYETLNRTNKYAIYYRLNDAKKPETRERRMKAFIEMLSKHEKFY